MNVSMLTSLTPVLNFYFFYFQFPQLAYRTSIKKIYSDAPLRQTVFPV